MSEYRVIGFLLAIGAAAGQTAPEAGRWAFTPAADEFSSEALLDLRYLNEGTAGENGFVRVDENGDFVLGDGRPARFWAVNTAALRTLPWTARPLGRRTAPDLARHARFLAKRGVNLIRLHAYLNPPATATSLSDINRGDRDWIWRAVAAMKKEGIYTVISPYWANNMRFNAAWGLPGGTALNAHGLLFFDPAMQTAYKAWLKALFAEVNPHTGIPLAEDPAVAVIQLQNEDSLLFWTVNELKGEQRQSFARKYAAWVKEKYGTLEAAAAAWNNNRVNGDDPANGLLEFHNLWEMTQNRTGGFARRLDDQLEFWGRTMYDFNRSMVSYLREELGCRQLVNATNWKTADTRLEDVERWSYTATDVAAVNRYYSGVHNGPNRGWAIIRNDEFTSPSILKNPRDFPLNLKQVRGYPFLVTESNWVMPMQYATEGPFLVAAYQSLTGSDAFFWFSTEDDEWTPPESANGFLASQRKWTFGTPDLLGTFPGAALMYRAGYVRRGDPVVVEERALEDLWKRRTPIIAESPSWDPNRDAGDIAPESSVKTAVDPLAFLAGPVLAGYGGAASDSRVADLSGLIAADRKQVTSVTGEVVMNTAANYCTVDSPWAQGVTAFFVNRARFELTDLTVESGNEYGAVLAVSMDGEPLAQSGRVLVQVGTESRPTGWVQEPKTIDLAGGQKVEGFRVVEFGRAPWAVKRADVRVTLRNGAVTRATVLDLNGNARGEIELTREGGTVQFRFPEDALYVVLR